MVRLQLTHFGYRVVEAANGREAVEAVGEEYPALILMDITMPVLDGLEATRMIRGMAERCGGDHRFPTLHRGKSRASALAAGCDDYVEKLIGIE